MSEQDDHEEINESILLSGKLEEAIDERDKLSDTLIKANKTITNLIRKESLLYPEIAKDAVVRTLTLEKADAVAMYNDLKEGSRTFAEAAGVLSALMQKIEQEVVDVEKVDPDNILAKRLRAILGHDSDPRNS